MKPIADSMLRQIETEKLAYPEQWQSLVPKFEHDIQKMREYLTEEERAKLYQALNPKQ